MVTSKRSPRSVEHPRLASSFRHWLVFATAIVLLTSGCSVRRLAMKSLANALTSGTSTSVLTNDNDPELVGDALPFALKTFELLLADLPDHPGLLLASCSGFTQYSLAWVEIDLKRLEVQDYDRYKEERERALNLYLRARGYCLHALDVAVPGTAERLVQEPKAALAPFATADVGLLFWTGSAWGSAISLGVDQPELVVDVPVVKALFERAEELDPDYFDGGLQEALMILETLPEAMGGSLERARRHYEKAVALHGGHRLTTDVNWAELVAVPQQDRQEFRRLLEKVLAADPDAVPEQSLTNRIAQKRARILLALEDDLFI